jgi:hypothetical protein
MKRFLAVLLVLVAGCSAETELTRLDATITAAELREGKVAVLGVVKFQEPDQIRPPLIATLEAVWREERPDVPMMTADSVRQALGAVRDRKLLLAYEYQGRLDESALEEIGDSLRGLARYVIVARVEKDRTRNSTRGINNADTTAARNYSMGITGRDATVAVQLYDLARKDLAVNARFEGSSENERPMLSPLQPRGTTEITIEGKSPVPPDELGYPGVPELAMALQQPFRNFARILPGSTKAPSSPPVEKR